eukprot:scaffold165337_cov17-Tisochrysis_lutea.AAC.2
MTNPHPPSLQTALKGNIIHSTFVVDALRLLTGGLVLHANQSEAGSNAAVNEENQTMLCMAFSPVNGRKLDDNIGSTTGNLLREQGAVFPIIVLRTFTQTGTRWLSSARLFPLGPGVVVAFSQSVPLPDSLQPRLQTKPISFLH